MAPIDYPAKTSEWGKVLIDTVNNIVIRIDKEMTSINDNMSNINANISTEFQTFREDLLVKVDEIKTTANSALVLAKKNEQFNKEIRNNLDVMREAYEVSNQSLSDEMVIIKKSNKKLCSENEHLRFQCERVNSKYKSLQQQTNNGENYNRRKNLVIRGIDEAQQETDDVCERALRIFLKVQPKIPDAVACETQFERCHRMGPKYRRNPRGNQSDLRRPVIVSFHDFEDKSVVWAGKSNLTDSRYSVNENFSRDTEYNRRKL